MLSILELKHILMYENNPGMKEQPHKQNKNANVFICKAVNWKLSNLNWEAV